MEKFKTVLNIASKQTNFGFGLVALTTAGGEQIFSSVAFKCPCNKLNFFYGMVFLLVPALALLLLGYILSKKTWKLFTGLWNHKERLCKWRHLVATSLAFFQISVTAMVAPSSWIAVALLNGKYYECAMTGTNLSAFNLHVCKDVDAEMDCLKMFHRIPCDGGNEEVLQTLRAQSQILGWLVIVSIMLSSLQFICVARCFSPISYLQLKFWRAYAQEESDLMDSHIVKHATELAERNLKSFFNQMPPKEIPTPSNNDWEKISSLYKFSTRDHYYSTLHRYVETKSDTESGMMRMMSIRSNETGDNPAVLDFVDGGIVPIC
ncbi:calcium homeostasis modulator protein 6 [Nothobranchius furzeri]|uniref:Calcium homeostasis modulator family member 6 n=4 Tax=Nothobranchius TaxID=28779 RepID=A0A1A8AUL4_NOTFU|nr:calcium homeostasis modulator protein 6 [Nothobranchius furzeri]KAF7226383.1 transcript variant X1 [Nothobranchius furzeri]